MLQNGLEEFLIESIYNNSNHTINPYEIIIHANVHPKFKEHELTGKSKIQIEDIKINYSICQFFQEKKGCTLDPLLKNYVCRSFICPTVEDLLPKDLIAIVEEGTTSITKEVHQFNSLHKQILKERKLNFQTDFTMTCDYLKSL